SPPLSPSQPHGNLSVPGGLLQEVLFSALEDRFHPRRDDHEPGDDEAPLARRGGILPLPTGAAGPPDLRRIIVTADDFDGARETLALVAPRPASAVSRSTRRKCAERDGSGSAPVWQAGEGPALEGAQSSLRHDCQPAEREAHPGAG